MYASLHLLWGPLLYQKFQDKWQPANPIQHNPAALSSQYIQKLTSPATALLLPCPSTITSCLDYCSCFRAGLLVSVPDHLLSLFPPSSQRDLSLPLVRWHLSLVQTLPECANLILSLPHWAPSCVPASYSSLLAPSLPATLRPPCCSLDVPSMLPPWDICTGFPLCLGSFPSDIFLAHALLPLAVCSPSQLVLP